MGREYVLARLDFNVLCVSFLCGYMRGKWHPSSALKRTATYVPTYRIWLACPPPDHRGSLAALEVFFQRLPFKSYFRLSFFFFLKQRKKCDLKLRRSYLDKMLQEFVCAPLIIREDGQHVFLTQHTESSTIIDFLISVLYEINLAKYL